MCEGLIEFDITLRLMFLALFLALFLPSHISQLPQGGGQCNVYSIKRVLVYKKIQTATVASLLLPMCSDLGTLKGSVCSKCNGL